MDLADRMIEVAACLCAQIDADGSPPTCFCGVVPGDSVVLAYATDCESRDGMAWVRLISMYPSSTLGEQSFVPGNCTGGIGAEVELGIVRSYPVSGDGEEPPPAVLEEIVRQQVKDAMTLYRTVLCCSSLPSKDVIVGVYTPTPILGGLAGGTISVTVGV